MAAAPLLLSLKLALFTTLLLLLAGLPLAWWLSVKKSYWKIIAEVFITLPLVLPPSVLGFYLLLAFSPKNAFGIWLQHTFNLRLVFSFEGLVVASVIYSLPFMVGPIKNALEHLPNSLMQASYTLGKSKWETFFRIQLPCIRGSIISACVLTFAHTLGEFGVVLMIGGNIPNETRVSAIAIYDAVESMKYAEAHLHAALLLAVTFVLVLLVHIFNKKSEKNVLG